MYNRFCALSTDAGPPALRAGRLDQTGSLKELKELNYLDSQHAFVSRNQSACSACVPLVSAAYTAWTNTTDKKGAAAKKNLKNKANSPLTCDLRRRKGAAPCAYTRFKQTLRLHYLCRGPPPAPICGGGSHYSGADTSDIIHSLPMCLCQVIAGEKRKTDQYISHGSDR